MSEPTTSEDTRSAITRAVKLLDAAIAVETGETYCRGATIAAMAIALGILQMLPGAAAVAEPPPSASHPPLRVGGTGLDWQRLGTVVRARRHWLGMSQDDVARAGGPANETQRRIELALRTKYDHRTLARAEKVLHWPSGTTAAILAGTAGDQRALITHDKNGQ